MNEQILSFSWNCTMSANPDPSVKSWQLKLLAFATSSFRRRVAFNHISDEMTGGQRSKNQVGVFYVLAQEVNFTIHSTHDDIVEALRKKVVSEFMLCRPTLFIIFIISSFSGICPRSKYSLITLLKISCDSIFWQYDSCLCLYLSFCIALPLFDNSYGHPLLWFSIKPRYLPAEM